MRTKWAWEQQWVWTVECDSLVGPTRVMVEAQQWAWTVVWKVEVVVSSRDVGRHVVVVEWSW